MSSSKDQISNCTICGGELSDGGFCPSCLLGLASEGGSVTVQPAGQSFGDYEILEELARGGMGVVYRARQRSLNRVVVVKMIHGGVLAGKDQIERFQYEAKTASRLSHPNIVPLYEIGEVGGQHFFTMKLIRGGTLSERIARIQLAGLSFRSSSDRSIFERRQAKIVDWVAKISRAVHYAHQHGVIHRDLKPSNILLSEDDEPYVGDFSLAKLVKEDSGLTMTGAVLGTPSYMSPEQAMGQVRNPTTAMDVYGIGTLLYEMITGRPPFVGESSVAVVRMVQESEPDGILKQVPGIRDDLVTICRRCLEKEPHRRYGSALEVAEDLERFQRFEPIVARAPHVLERGMLWCRRRPLVAGLGAIVFLSVLIGFIAVTWQWGEAEAAREKVIETNAALDDTIERLDQRLVDSMIGEGDPALALRYLADRLRQEPHHFAAASRAASILERFNFCLPGAYDLPHEEGIQFVDTSRDSKVLLTLSSAFRPQSDVEQAGRLGRLANLSASKSPNQFSSSVKVWRLGEERTLEFDMRVQGVPNATALSPDGSLVAISRGKNISIYKLGRKRRFASIPNGSRVRAIRFAPNGDRIVVGAQDRIARVWNVRSRQLEFESVRHPDYVHDARLSPDGAMLLSTSTHCIVSDLETGRVLFQIGGHGGYIYSAEYSPAGDRILVASSDHSATLWSAGTGELVGKAMPHARGVKLATFSADGLRVATADLGGRIRIWDGETGDPISSWLQHEKQVNSLDFSSDGRLLASASNDQTVCVWDGFSGERIAEPIRLGDWVVAAKFIGENGQLLTATLDGMAMPWDVRPGIVVPESRPSEGGRLFDRVGETEVVSLPVHRGHFALTVPSSIEGINKFRILIKQIHGGRFRTIQLDPEAKRVLLASADGGVRLIDVERYRNLVGELEPDELPLVPNVKMFPFFGESGSRAARQGEDILFETDEKFFSIDPLDHPAAVLTARFDSRGKLVATACSDSEVRLWDSHTGQRLDRPSMSHLGPVLDVAFGPHDRRLASCSEDRSVRIWDVETGALIAAPFLHEGPVSAVAWSPAGDYLVSGTGSGLIQVWEVETGEPIAEPFQARGELEFLRIEGGDFEISYRVTGSEQTEHVSVVMKPSVVPKWFAPLLEFVAGGAFKGTTPSDYAQFQSLREEILESGGDDVRSQWGRWFLADRSSRAIFPGASPIIADYLESFSTRPVSEIHNQSQLPWLSNMPEIYARLAGVFLEPDSIGTLRSTPLARAYAKRGFQMSPENPAVRHVYRSIVGNEAWVPNQDANQGGGKVVTIDFSDGIPNGISDFNSAPLIHSQREQAKRGAERIPVSGRQGQADSYVWATRSELDILAVRLNQKWLGNMLGARIRYDVFQGGLTERRGLYLDYADVSVSDGKHILLADLGLFPPDQGWRRCEIELSVTTDWRVNSPGTPFDNANSFRAVSGKEKASPELVFEVLSNLKSVNLAIEQRVLAAKGEPFVAVDNVRIEYPEL